jgi:hypothetical protein
VVGPPPGVTQPASGVAEAHSTAEPLTAPLLQGVRGSPAPRKPTVGRPRESGGPCSHGEVHLTSHLRRPAGSCELAPLEGSLALTSSSWRLR